MALTNAHMYVYLCIVNIYKHFSTKTFIDFNDILHQSHSKLLDRMPTMKENFYDPFCVPAGWLVKVNNVLVSTKW